MFDDTTVVAEKLQPGEMVAIGRSEAFTVCDGEPDQFGWIRANHKGLTLAFSPAKAKLSVRGSLATFAKGHNLHLLTYVELQLACPSVAAAVGLPMTRLRLVGLELSLDMDSTTSPQHLLQTLQHHKNSKFEIVKQRKGVARPMEFVASHANYSMKLYDKGLWEAQHGKYLPAGHYKARFEVVMTRARPINALLNRSKTTLADLITMEFCAAAVAHLEQRWKEVVRTKPLTFTGLSGKDRLLLGAGGNPEYWRGLKRDKAGITVKRQKKKYKELVAYSASMMPPDEYEQQFSAALAALLAPVLAIQNDTILHTSSPMEEPSLRIDREPLPIPTAEGLLVGSSPDDDERAGRQEGPPAPHLADDDERERAAPAPRCCQMCHRPLNSERPPGAKFCSQLERGSAKEAKRCRNAASNPGHNARRTLRKIESQPLLFHIREFVRVPEQIRAFVLAAA